MSPETGRRSASISRWALAIAVVLLAAGCRQDMHDQPRDKPLARSDFFANGSSARMLPAHTVARGDLHADKLFYTGFTPEGDPTPTLPVPVTRELLLRGQERFNIFCSPCHGRTGEGRGMVVRRGYKQPPSYHIDRLRQAPAGYFFDIITNGFGVMPSYAAQIPAEDRWAIVAYVRTLQLSRDFDASKLTSEQRARLDQPAAAPAAGENE